MGEVSKIQWTHATFNPWWGCTKVSPGCTHCYAETFSKRTGHNIWGKDASRRFFGAKHWAEPVKWNRDAMRDGERRRVFCASMSDVFEDMTTMPASEWEKVEDARFKLFDLIERTHALDWLLLTKRPQNILPMIPARWREDRLPANVWVGTTVEDQKRADERIPHLLKVPAAVRFLSCEPLLGRVKLDQVENRLNFAESQAWLDALGGRVWDENRASGYYDITTCEYGRVDWVIVGGESGPGSRLMELAWAKQIIDDCKAVGVPVFAKQTGAVLAREWKLRDAHKGGDPDEWPEWMRVREFPTAHM